MEAERITNKDGNWERRKWVLSERRSLKYFVRGTLGESKYIKSCGMRWSRIYLVQIKCYFFFWQKEALKHCSMRNSIDPEWNKTLIWTKDRLVINSNSKSKDNLEKSDILIIICVSNYQLHEWLNCSFSMSFQSVVSFLGMIFWIRPEESVIIGS